jgi:hypothetical protein
MGKSTAVARNPFLAAAVRPLSAKVLEMTSLRAMINTIKLARITAPIGPINA